MRHIKAFFIKVWVWLTPQAVKNAIQADFMRQMVNYKPSFGTLSHPLLRRINYGEVARGMIQVEPLPAAAKLFYDPRPTEKE